VRITLITSRLTAAGAAAAAAAARAARGTASNAPCYFHHLNRRRAMMMNIARSRACEENY